MTSKQKLRAKALELSILIEGPLTDEDRNAYPNKEYTMEKYRPTAKVIERLIKEADPGQT
jgi:hypothetical protein